MNCRRVLLMGEEGRMPYQIRFMMSGLRSEQIKADILGVLENVRNQRLEKGHLEQMRDCVSAYKTLLQL